MQFNSVRIYKKGEVILRAEDDPPGVFYIKKGFARLYSISLDGREITFNIFKPCSYFPMMWAIGNSSNSYFLEALTEVEIYRAPKNQLIEYLKKEPEVLFELTRKILVGLDGFLSMMENLIFGSAYMKIASVILVAAKRFGETKGNGEVEIQLPLTHKIISSLAGLTRETTSLELEKLRKEKIIVYNKHLIAIKNMEKLKQKLFGFRSDKSLPDAF